VERACILAESDMITEKDLAVSLPASSDPPVQMAPPTFSDAMIAVESEQVPADDDRESLASIERDHIMRTLRRAGGNKKAAAKMLGLSRRALYRRLERHQLDETITRRKPGELAAVE
jgi:DNA-binding NtrC family response regulator